jgi:luciferase family oxidoreductase group 1
VASAATAVVLCHVAGGTSTIRVGAGGVMLPNHAPLVIAEQFGTLESLFPGRIDLGLGRAAGADQRTLRALRRPFTAADTFPQDVLELQSLLAAPEPGQAVRAVPGAGLRVPLWILGSSLFGAELAAALGLPYMFAAHVAPRSLGSALAAYRAGFAASPQLDRPYAMVAVNVVVAETDAAARALFTSVQQGAANLLRNTRSEFPPPVDDIDAFWSEAEKAHASAMLACSFVGSPATVAAALSRFIGETGADEVLAVSNIFDHAARLRSYELLSEVAQGL